MNLIQEEYTLDVGESAGARVVVHAQNTMPFPEVQTAVIYQLIGQQKQTKYYL